MSFHVPVMVQEVVDHLVLVRDGQYLDATAGGGGHSLAILDALGPEGRLLASDRDAEAVAETEARLAGFGQRVQVCRASFEELADCCRRAGMTSLQGVLFDLGVSSHQLDEAERGFSFRTSGPLDMRMDGRQDSSAATWLAHASEREITRIIRDFGEERKARRIARSIVSQRSRHGIHSTADLREAVARTHPDRLAKTLARVFQAIRIAVNQELAQLSAGLDAVTDLLAPGGRLVVLSYQSGEDRVVKSKLGMLIRGCTCPPEAPVCTCGGKPSFRKILRRPLTPTDEEIAGNPRARSARMRVFEKLQGADHG